MMEPYSLFGILVLVLDLIAIVGVVLGSGTAGHKVLWTVVILIFPVVGMVLYYAIGRSARDA